MKKKKTTGPSERFQRCFVQFYNYLYTTRRIKRGPFRLTLWATDGPQFWIQLPVVSRFLKEHNFFSSEHSLFSKLRIFSTNHMINIQKASHLLFSSTNPAQVFLLVGTHLFNFHLPMLRRPLPPAICCRPSPFFFSCSSQEGEIEREKRDWGREQFSPKTKLTNL